MPGWILTALLVSAILAWRWCVKRRRAVRIARLIKRREKGVPSWE
jgi:hypothetical protein